MTQLLHEHIRDVPDFPKPGILFKDITPLLKSNAALSRTIELLADRYQDKGIDIVAGIESRGFLFAIPLALRLGIGMIPIRKPGKLPYKTRKASYALEYGTDSIEIHEDAVSPGQRVLLLDDLLATGGTAEAAGKLLEELGGEVVEYAFVIELEGLEGRKKLKPERTFSLLRF